MAEQEGKTIHSVAKAIRLLDLLTAAGQPASLTELYQKTGWPKSTIHGLLSLSLIHILTLPTIYSV